MNINDSNNKKKLPVIQNKTKKKITKRIFFGLHNYAIKKINKKLKKKHFINWKKKKKKKNCKKKKKLISIILMLCKHYMMDLLLY